jgi:hypothetical protein
MSYSHLRQAVRVGVEVFVASYGSTLSAAALMYLLYALVEVLGSRLTFHEFNRIFSLPYFPVQIACGFAVGCIGRERFGTRFTMWVWTVPLLIFTWHLVAFKPSVLQNFWLSRFEHFLGSGCRPPVCFDQLRYTSPLYTSIAYSSGAAARAKFAELKNQETRE